MWLIKACSLQALPQYLINAQGIHLLKVKIATHWAQVLSTSVSKRGARRCESQFSTPQGLETFAWGLGKEAELQSQLRAKSDSRDIALLSVPGALGLRGHRLPNCALRRQIRSRPSFWPQKALLRVSRIPPPPPPSRLRSPGPSKLSPLTLYCTAP